MPKEVIRNGEEELTVGWSEPENGVQIGVDLNKEFKFLDEDDWEYTGLFFSFRTPEQIDELIKNLRLAKRKAF